MADAADAASPAEPAAWPPREIGVDGHRVRLTRRPSPRPGAGSAPTTYQSAAAATTAAAECHQSAPRATPERPTCPREPRQHHGPSTEQRPAADDALVPLEFSPEPGELTGSTRGAEHRAPTPQSLG